MPGGGRHVGCDPISLLGDRSWARCTHTHQWHAVQRTTENRMSGIASAPSLSGRRLLFNMDLACLIMYTAQLSAADDKIRKCYTCSTQQVN